MARSRRRRVAVVDATGDRRVVMAIIVVTLTTTLVLLGEAAPPEPEWEEIVFLPGTPGMRVEKRVLKVAKLAPSAAGKNSCPRG